MASGQCWVYPLTQVGHNHTLSQNTAIHSYYVPFFSPLLNSDFSPSGIPLLTQSTFSSVSSSRSIPSILNNIHPLTQPTNYHPFFPHGQTISTYSLILSSTPFFPPHTL